MDNKRKIISIAGILQGFAATAYMGRDSFAHSRERQRPTLPTRR